MCMLFQPAGSGKCLSTLLTCMASCSNMARSNVSLQVARIREYFLAIFAGKSSKFTVNHLMSEEVRSPSESFIAVFADVLIAFISVSVHHMSIQSR